MGCDMISTPDASETDAMVQIWFSPKESVGAASKSMPKEP